MFIDRRVLSKAIHSTGMEAFQISKPSSNNISDCHHCLEVALAQVASGDFPFKA
jgi:hypothetical protein